jgi:hypothetical protein
MRRAESARDAHQVVTPTGYGASRGGELEYPHDAAQGLGRGLIRGGVGRAHLDRKTTRPAVRVRVAVSARRPRQGAGAVWLPDREARREAKSLRSSRNVQVGAASLPGGGSRCGGTDSAQTQPCSPVDHQDTDHAEPGGNVAPYGSASAMRRPDAILRLVELLAPDRTCLRRVGRLRVRLPGLVRRQRAAAGCKPDGA